MVTVGVCNAESAEARVTVYTFDSLWHATLDVADKDGVTITLHVPGGHELKVQAIQAGLDMVEWMRVAFMKLADAETMKDFQASVDEKKLVENGAEAL